MARAVVLTFLAALCCVASWMFGYREGQQVGAFHLMHEMNVTSARDAKEEMDFARDRVCNEIKRYKFSIARDLEEHTQICGARGIDGPENSN